MGTACLTGGGSQQLCDGVSFRERPQRVGEARVMDLEEPGRPVGGVDDPPPAEAPARRLDPKAPGPLRDPPQGLGGRTPLSAEPGPAAGRAGAPLTPRERAATGAAATAI
jgi:hypothetical protein